MRPADVRDPGEDDTDATPPAHYGSLEAIEREAFALLSRGANDRRSACHTTVFVTSGLDGCPAARTVVLRGFAPEPPMISFHTDIRSGKIAELAENDRAAAVFYDPDGKVQIRASGACSIHHKDPVAQSVWDRLGVSARRTYLGAPPGDLSDQPTSGLPEFLETNAASLEQSERGFEHFAILRLHVRALEWLYLCARGHRRARFSWAKNGGKRTATWLVP